MSIFRAGECENESPLPRRQGQGRGQGTAKGTGTWGPRERNASQERTAPRMQAGRRVPRLSTPSEDPGSPLSPVSVEMHG